MSYRWRVHEHYFFIFYSLHPHSEYLACGTLVCVFTLYINCFHIEVKAEEHTFVCPSTCRSKLRTDLVRQNRHLQLLQALQQIVV